MADGNIIAVAFRAMDPKIKKPKSAQMRCGGSMRR